MSETDEYHKAVETFYEDKLHLKMNRIQSERDDAEAVVETLLDTMMKMNELFDQSEAALDQMTADRDEWRREAIAAQNTLALQRLDH